MDIIKLLEFLNPAKDVVTVQIANNKDWIDSAVDISKAVLPALATAVVAWLAMNKSHRQFERNSKRQSDEFKLGIEQQVKSLKIQTQLATEVDLKKEISKGVRESCSQFLSLGLEANRQSGTYKLACEYVDNGNHKFLKDRDDAHAFYMKAAAEMASARVMLMSFLDPQVDEEFYSSIAKVTDLLRDDSSAFGSATGICLIHCRKFIAKKHQEIIDLTSSITS